MGASPFQHLFRDVPLAAEPGERPDPHEYLMGVAMVVRERANCKGSRVGAVLAIDERIISTGYNGTPEDMTNCLDGGCHRCAHREEFGPGTAYDVCICVHAEQNALLAASRFGIDVEGATVYTTIRPCFGCMKELLQANVAAIYYLHDWSRDKLSEELQKDYLRMDAKFSEGGRLGVHKLSVLDPREDWALGRPVGPPPDTGHSAGGS